jgi:hypothetical protein
MWYHHYLQHPGHTFLKETMKAAIYWKGMRKPVTKSCKTCQVNKRGTQKYRLLPSKIIISAPYEALCVYLVRPFTLKSKDGSLIDFMALTMINPASSWFKVQSSGHGSYHEWSCLQLVWSSEITNNQSINDQSGQQQKENNRRGNLSQVIWSNQLMSLQNLVVQIPEMPIFNITTGLSLYYTLKHYVIHTT